MKNLRTVYSMIAVIGLPFAISAPLIAGNAIKLEGSVSLNEDYCTKGTTDPECSLSFEIKGKAAKIIYDGMPEKGAMQECTGNVEKFNESGMHCIKGKDANDYYCDFGYYFKKQSFGAGPDGC